MRLCGRFYTRISSVEWIPIDVRRFAYGAICPGMRVPPGVNASDDRPTTCTSVLVYDTTTYTCRTDISLSQCRLSCDRCGGSPVRSLGSRSRTSLHCGKTDDAAVDIGFTWISRVKIPEGRADKLLMFIPLSLMSRQTPTLSLSVAPLVNRSYTQLASAERAANTATVDFDTGRLQPYMSAPEEQTLAHVARQHHRVKALRRSRRCPTRREAGPDDKLSTGCRRLCRRNKMQLQYINNNIFNV